MVVVRVNQITPPSSEYTRVLLQPLHVLHQIASPLILKYVPNARIPDWSAPRRRFVSLQVNASLVLWKTLISIHL